MKKILALFAGILAFTSLSAKPDPIDVKYGPWVTNVTETSFTVIWTTATDNLGWVEVTTQNKGSWARRNICSFHQEFAGRWMYGTLHSVDVTGLEKGTRYYYRVCGKALVDESEPQDMAFGMDKAMDKVGHVTTLDSSKETCCFSIVNDIHNDRNSFSALMNQVDASKTDFILLNGDITSAGNYCIDTLAHYYIAPLGANAMKLPVMFARGNHEGRGRGWKDYYTMFPTQTRDQFYYTFREGPVAFIVLDSGETKPVVSKTLRGEPYYSEYLEKELEWAREAMKDPSFAQAPFKVCIIHVPFTTKPNALDYCAQNWMRENFTPLMNQCGIDLALNAHTHKYFIHEKGTFDNNFPMVINGANERMQFFCDGKAVTLTVYDTSGAEIHRTTIPAK